MLLQSCQITCDVPLLPELTPLVFFPCSPFLKNGFSLAPVLLDIPPAPSRPGPCQPDGILIQTLLPPQFLLVYHGEDSVDVEGGGGRFSIAS